MSDGTFGSHASPLWRAVVLALGLTLLSGCTTRSEYMLAPTTPEPMGPSASAATVVFVRPSTMRPTNVVTIFDAQGRFLGDAQTGSHFSVKVSPGKHLFIAWAENTAPLEADLLAGRIYYVEVAPAIGALSARVHLLTISPRVGAWANLPYLLADTDRLIADERSGQAYLDSRQSDVADRVRRAWEVLNELTLDQLGERTLYPGDGQLAAPASR